MQLIETAFAGSEVVVKSPDHLVSATGAIREVDVSIRGKVGHNTVLIVCECRDRRAKADEPWIEQLVEKRRTIRADKLIAVSRSGFTKSAMIKAAQCGISARTITELDLGQVREWCEMETANLFADSISVHHCSFVPANDPENRSGRILSESIQAAIKQTLHTPIIQTSKAGSVSIIHMVDSWRGQNPDFDIPVGVSRHKISIRDAEGPMWIETGDGPIELSHVELYLQITRREDKIPLTRAVEYAENGGGLAQLVQFGSDQDAVSHTPFTYTLVRGSDGVVRVFLRDNRAALDSPSTTPP